MVNDLFALLLSTEYPMPHLFRKFFIIEALFEDDDDGWHGKLPLEPTAAVFFEVVDESTAAFGVLFRRRPSLIYNKKEIYILLPEFNTWTSVKNLSCLSSCQLNVNLSSHINRDHRYFIGWYHCMNKFLHEMSLFNDDRVISLRTSLKARVNLRKIRFLWWNRQMIPCHEAAME